MKRMVLRAAFVALFAWAGPAFAAIDGAPAWLQRAVNVSTPPDAGEAPALVLLDETTVQVSPDGVATTTRRLAIRVLTQVGRSFANTRVHYVQNHDRVRSTRAWLVRKDALVKATEHGEWADVAMDTSGALFGEFRSKSVSRLDDVLIGDVFAAETQIEEPMLLAQVGNIWRWQLPVVEETFQLTVPPGFKITPSMHGQDVPSMASASDNRTTIWTKHGQPFVRAEPLMPERDPAAPTLFVTLEPPAGASAFKPLVLKSWSDFARWIDSLNAGQCDTDPQLAETVRRLTGGSTETIAKIRALGSYVQKLRYVARNEGIGKGYGYQAHKATQVLRYGYGDCKDKANLLRAMLRQAGVTAYIASARSGDDRPVWEDFPSPMQFDHAIVAIRVEDTAELPAIVRTEKWGRLLFFDATDPHTAVGDLPAHLQGTFVHLVDSESDRLVQLPRIPAVPGHVYLRKATLQLAPSGAVSGKITVSGQGQAGTELRRDMFNASTEESLRKLVTEQLGESTRAAQLKALSREDSTSGTHCGISFELSKPNHLQFLKSSLAVARLDVLGRGPLPVLSAPTRQAPVKLVPMAWEDTVELTLPAEFTPEEIPAAVALSSDYGRYERTVEVEGKVIKLTRRVEIKSGLIPASEYAALKKFLSDIGKADRASVLLKTGA